LHHYMGEIDGAFRAWGFQKGGTGAISESIASAARALGAEVRTNAAVERVLVRDGRATGVALASGEEIAAPVVVSGLDPKRTLLELADPGAIAPTLRWRSGNYRTPGVVAKVNLVLDRRPTFPAANGAHDQLPPARTLAAPRLDSHQHA